MYPQYAEEIVNAVNENFSETPDLEGKSVAAEDDGSLKADWMHLRNDAYGVEMYQNVIDEFSNQLPELASGSLDAKGFCKKLTDAAQKND